MDDGNTQENNVEIAQRVVKTFSWKTFAADPDDSLSKSLVTAEENTRLNSDQEPTLKQQWLQLFDPTTRKTSTSLIFRSGDKEEIILAEPTEELANVYQKFLKCLPKDHTARVEDGPPDIRVVMDALIVAESNWKNNREKTRLGRMKKLFGKFSINVSKFKDVFAVVPSGDKYTCLVTGTISAIIKATVNHEKIAESVSTALDDLGEDIAYWQELLKANDYSARVEHYVARLFVVVFKFLANIMTKWSSKSATGRMFRSFDSDFFKEEIEMKRAGIRDLEYKLNRQADLDWRRELKTSIEANSTMVKEFSAMQVNLNAEWLLHLGQHEKSLGLSVKHLLEQGHLNMQRELASTSNTTATQTMERSAAGEKEQQDMNPSYYTAEEVRLTTLLLLRPYVVQQQNVPQVVAKSKTFSIHREVFQKIHLWNAISASQRLWILGPYQVPQPSQYTHLSAHVVLTAQGAEVPVIYFFGNTTSRVIDLIYTLIVQVAKAVPYQFQSTLDFSRARFEAVLTGKDDSLRQATRLLQDLISIANTPMLLIVIDGVRMLDRSAATRAQLKEVVAALTMSMNAFASRAGVPGTSAVGGGGKQALKILFITDGFTDALLELKGNERLNHMDFAGEDDEADGVLLKLTMRQ